jgi:hypothetical protein
MGSEVRESEGIIAASGNISIDRGRTPIRDDRKFAQSG